jgi:putative oxidoreductase
METIMNRVLEQHREWGVTVLRVVIGVIFLMHGYQKLFVYGIGGVAQGFGQMGIPAPAIGAVLATAAEGLGGLLLILGLFTRFAAIPIAFTMVVAILTAHLHGGFFAPKGFEYPLALLGASVALVFLGSGKLALDNVLWRREHRDVGFEPVATARPARA